MEKWLTLIVITLICVITGSNAEAGLIPSDGYYTAIAGSYYTGGGVGVWNPRTDLANNDNSSMWGNVIAMHWDYIGIGPVDAILNVANSGGVSEYRTWNLSDPSYWVIQNNGTETWRGFHIYLGYGFGDDFILSSSDDMLDFDTPHRDPVPTSTVFTSLNHQDNSLTWTGGTVNPGQSVLFEYHFDLPDANSYMPESALIDDGYRMTMRFLPSTDGGSVVPEPSSMLLLGMGLMGAGFFRRKKKT